MLWVNQWKGAVFNLFSMKILGLKSNFIIANFEKCAFCNSAYSCNFFQGSPHKIHTLQRFDLME